MSKDKHYVQVAGHRLAYRESGQPDGPPVVFVHGNPTSSFLWRNVIPYAEPYGRCLAPDLVGMGDSDKIAGVGDDRYRFDVHAEHFAGFMESTGAVKDVTLVLHDWGSALGFDWAARHPDRVRALVYMESICGPMSFADWPESGQSIFQAMRQPETGEELVLQKNVFVERILPSSVIRSLDEAEMSEYRRPFAEPGEGRRPTLTWPRELPFDGAPASVAAIVADYSSWLADTETPKLYVHAEPGFMSQVYASRCRQWRNQTEVVVRGVHFIQEDSPDDIGSAIADFVAGLPPVPRT